MLKSYSQNKEDLFIADYFGKHKGNLLSVGENDGLTFSNARLLIEQGWGATLVEPSSMFARLEELYKDDPNITLHNFAIGTMPGQMTFYESEAHVKGGKDRALVSTLDFDETIRWRKSGVKFTERVVEVKPYDFKEKFDFISIDIEGLEWDVLQQIDLTHTKCLCIEFNGKIDLQKLFTDYCAKFNLKLAVKNSENLIFIS